MRPQAGKKDRPSSRQRPPRQRPRTLRAPQKRATSPSFARRFSLRFLAPLPLRWGAAGTPRFPPHHYRSFYRPTGKARRRRFWAAVLTNPRRRPSWFELALTLLDCSPLRACLEAPLSARGEKPFDPLSLLLVCLWKIASAQPWEAVAAMLADAEKGLAWRACFGFSLPDTPAESTLRAFRDRLPEGFLNTLLQLFLTTLDHAGLLPSAAPYGYLLSGDGQLHDARSAHRCHHARPTCYQALGPGQTRPCPAREATHGHYGCLCDTEACRSRCTLAPRLDPEAGFVIYSETKRTANGEKVEQIKRAVFGYRSLATRLLDEQLHLAWTVRTDLYAAPTDEGTTFPAAFRAAVNSLPQPRVAYAFYDSACGEKQCLDAVYDLGGIPLFDIRADAGDRDRALCRARGYDEHGWPLCPQGHPLSYLGLERRVQVRARWACQQACRKSPGGEVAECPWLKKRRGYYFYLTRCFRDGSYRLARLVPYGSKQWEKRTGWRNLSEGRNSGLERLGLKRLPDYGLRHAAFLITGADVVENLSTLARLVWEATGQDAGWVVPEEQEIGRVPEPEAGPEEDQEPAEEEPADR